MKALIMGSSFIYEAKYDQDVIRSLKVGLEDGVACDVILTYKDKDGNTLGVYKDETYVENRAIKYPFNIKEIAESLKINEEDVDHLIAAVDIDHDGEIAKGEEVKLKIAQPLNILVLVAGTTDATNLDDIGTRAISYNTKSVYWDKEFLLGVKKYQQANKQNLIVFDKHGWTGDNRIKNREIAGAYLVNRLCGAEGQKPYYPAYKKRAVNFHLLGHSHGGNVINEMTKQMDKLGEEWPEEWKVKSITYLSTPFFNTIHQVKVTDKTFHKNAEVLNVYNKYDLTQRMLADFSLEPLASVLQILDFSELENNIEKLQQFKFPELNYSLEDVDKRWYGVDIQLVIPHNQGVIVYEKMIELFQIAEAIMGNLLDIVRMLSKKITFKVGEEIKNDLGEEEIVYKRTIITKEIRKGLEKIINRITEQLQINLNNLNKRNKTLQSTDRSYALSWLIDDIEINGLVKNLSDFLKIDAKTLVSKRDEGLWHLVYQILDHNIKKFDNTYTDPTPQFKDTPLANKVEQYPVFKEDKYNGSDGSKNFDPFISYINDIEKRCAQKPSEYDLLDLVFTLIQQMGVVYKYKGIGFGTALKVFANGWKYNRWSHFDFSVSNFEKRLFQLSDMVDNYQKIFQKRDFGGILDTSDILTSEEKAKGMMQRGSIPYLLIESHSTSRRVLLPKVKQFLQKVGAKK
jgi:hypothetical protein